MVKRSQEARGAQKGASKKGDKMQAGTGQRPAEKANARIDPRIQREIGKHLRAHYDDVINEPVPDRFIELLQQLEQSVKRKR